MKIEGVNTRTILNSISVAALIVSGISVLLSVLNHKSTTMIKEDIKHEIENDIKREILQQTNIEEIEKSVRNTATEKLNEVIENVKTKQLNKLMDTMKKSLNDYEKNINKQVGDFDKRLKNMEMIDNKVWNSINNNVLNRNNDCSKNDVIKSIINNENLSAYEMARLIDSIKETSIERVIIVNTKQISLYLTNENMYLEHVSGHILLFKNNKVVKVFHGLSEIESYLKKQGIIPNKYYDNHFKK